MIKDEQLQELEDKVKEVDARLQEQVKTNGELAFDKETLQVLFYSTLLFDSGLI